MKAIQLCINLLTLIFPMICNYSILTLTYLLVTSVRKWMVLIRLVAIQMYQYCPLGRAVLSYWHICIFKLFFSLLLIRIGYTDEAAMYIRKSLEINPDYTAARENLDNICCHLVERWHFRMLNDVNRNTAFLSALQKAAKLGYNSVLDMGAGTGILR